MTGLMSMEAFYNLEDILSTVGKNEYFAEFLNTRNLEAGVIKLREGQKDTQCSHSLDELYYVIEGEGYITISQKNYWISKGMTIFVPSKTPHHFHGNRGNLIVLYIFAKTGIPSLK